MVLRFNPLLQVPLRVSDVRTLGSDQEPRLYTKDTEEENHQIPESPSGLLSRLHQPQYTEVCRKLGALD